MGELALNCHMISPFLIDDEVALKLLDEIDEVETHLGDIELSEGLLKRLVRGAQLMNELYTMDSTYIEFPEIKRSVTEFKGGYKLAIQRGARLNEVEVFNMFFRIKSNRINSVDDLPTAQMYTTREGQRIILLHPDSTSARIDEEKNVFLNKTLQLVQQGRVSQETLVELNDNLLLLNIHERCAQTLIHENGHILHWKKFDHLFKKYDIDNIYPENVYSSDMMNFVILHWFEKYNYIYNVAARIPDFKTYELKKKISYLKESFVEDYRVGLNMQSLNGKFILPNAYCVAGDLMEPELSKEGVRLVRMMMNESNNQDKTKYTTGEAEMGQEMELNRSSVSSFFLDKAIKSDWRPGKDSFKKEDFEDMISELFGGSVKKNYSPIFNEAAVSLVIQESDSTEEKLKRKFK